VTGTLPATFMRGGTSKALMFRRDDLPGDRDEWDP
jgi:2-methylaconitate cis-trans-isomerase PrpF